MTDDVELWRRAKQVLQEALERRAEERASFVADACGADVALRAEVESLLAAHDAAGRFGEQPAIERLGAAPTDGARRLNPGDRLGPYAIEQWLGAGGMGEVYKAVDTRLDRTVAIKILTDIVGADVRLRQRFEREAKVIAALHHPHICALHDVGEIEGVAFLVMEYLDGESLAQRLSRGPLPADAVRRYGLEITEALAKLHQHGIVHRDVKPANIMLTSEGAKLLDFGTATLRPNLGVNDRSAADHDPLTAPRTIVGTLHYMAPEQLEGREVDARTDVFAFGTVLYEMVAGKRAFDGQSDASVVAAILEREPATLAQSGAPVPRGLESIIRKCFRKSPADRWQTAGDLLDALRRVPGAVERRTHWWRWVASAAALAVVGVLAWSALSTHRASRPTDPQPMVIGSMRQLTTGEGLEIDPGLSPDGKFVTYSAGSANQVRVYVRATAGGRPIPLSDAASAFEYQPRWSPDGTEILYITGQAAYVAPAFGGTPRRVDATSASASAYAGEWAGILGIEVTDAAWSPDGRRIAVAHGKNLIVVSRDGSATPRALASAPADLHHCNWSGDDGRWIACTSGNWRFAGPGGIFGNAAPSRIVLIPTGGGPIRELTDMSAQNQSPVWAADGKHLFFVSNRQGTFDVYAVEMSAQGQPVGSPIRITTGLGVYSMALSTDGKRLVYARYSTTNNIFSVPIPKTGTVDAAQARAVTTGNQIVDAMTVSRDGKWLVYDSTLLGNADIFRMPTGGGPSERLTTDPAGDFAPELSPDGRLLAYHSWRTGSRDVFAQPVDGGPADQLTATPAQEAYPTWFADGRSLLFMDLGGENHYSEVRRDDAGHWGTSRALPFLQDAQGLILLRDGRTIACARQDLIWTVDLESHARRELYRRRAPSDPGVASIRQDLSGDPLYIKSHDAQGFTSFWSVPLAGGRPRRLVTFSDPAKQSSRFEFTVDATRFYFTIDERRSNIWMADMTP